MASDPALAYLPAYGSDPTAAPVSNPFIPDKLQTLGMLLGGLGAGISSAAQRNQSPLMGVSEGAQNFNNSYYGALTHGLNYDLARKKYELDASYRNAEMRKMGIETNILQRQQDAFEAFMKGGGVPGMRAPPTPLMGPGSTPATTQTARDESGGDPTITNPVSGAQGLYQAMPATWADVATRHPEIGLPFNPKQATVEQQNAFKGAFDRDNAQTLTSLGVAPTDASLYLAHRFGAKGAAAFLQAPDNTPIAQVLPADWVRQNPDLQRGTVGDFKNSVSQRYGGGFQQAQAGPRAAPSGMPQMPGPPPSVAGYSNYALGGPLMGKIGEGLKADALNQYKFQSDQFNRALEIQKFQQSINNGEVIQDTKTGQWVPNPAKAQAAGATAAAVEQAKVKAKNDTYFPPGFDKMTEEQKLAALPANVRGVVQDLGSGELALSDLPTRMASSGVDPTKVDIHSITKNVYGDKYDMRAGEQRKVFENEINNPDGKNLGPTRFSLNTAYQHINQYQDLMKAVDSHDTQAINHVLDLWNTASGNPKFTNARALQHHLATEVARVVKGGNQLNQDDIESGVNSLSTAASWAQAKGTLGVWMHAMDARWNTVTDAAHALNIPQKKIDGWLGPAAVKAKAAFDETQNEPAKGEGAPPKAAQGAAPKPGTVLGKLQDGREVYIGQDGKRYVR